MDSFPSTSRLPKTDRAPTTPPTVTYVVVGGVRRKVVACPCCGGPWKHGKG